MSSVTVEDTSYGETSTATVEGVKRNDAFVFVQCWTPDFEGEYVFAAYYAVVGDDPVTVGPFATGSTWSTPAPAQGRAQVGFFKARGFGDWKPITEPTTFDITV
jgi:hypothetical protein